MRTICSAGTDFGGHHAIIEYKGYRGRLVPPEPEAGLPCYRIEPVEGPAGYWEGTIACASPDVAEKQFQLAVKGHIRVDRYRRARQRGPRPFRWLNLGEWAHDLGIGRDVVASLRREEFADNAGVRALSLTLYQRPRRVTRTFVGEFAHGFDDDHLIDMLLPDVWVPERLCSRWLHDRAMPIAKAAQPLPSIAPESTEPIRPRRSWKADYKEWVRWWVEQEGVGHPSVDDDMAHLRSLGHSIPRAHLRRLRAELAPPHWKKEGAPKAPERQAKRDALNRAKKYFRPNSAQ